MNKPLSAPSDLLAYSRENAIYAGNGSIKHAQVSTTPEYVEYWRAIMMRKWSILSLAAIAGIIAAAIVSQIDSRYRSTAMVLIESSKAKVVQVEDVYSGVSANREYFQTQAEVIKSRDVAQRVVRLLGLSENAEFDPRQRRAPFWESWLVARLPFLQSLFPTIPVRKGEDAVEAAVLRSFVSRLTVEPVRMSQLVKVSFDSTDPILAAAIANAIVDSYIQSDISARMKMTASAGSWINERLSELKSKLDASERQLQSYREREGMLDGKSMILGGNARQLEELTQRLVEAKVRRSEAEEAYNQVKVGEGNNFETVPAVVRNQAVQRAKELEAEAEKRLAEVSQRYGPDHPKHASAESELATARATSRRQIQTVVASTVKEYNAAKATEKTIEDSLNQSKGLIQNLNRKEIQLGVLEREVVANRQLYQTFLSRYKETNVTGDSQQPNARLIEAAVPGLIPVWPLRRQWISSATILGLLLGCGIALLLRALNNTVNTSEDVEKRLGHPFLAALPKIVGKNRNNPSRELVDYPQGHYAESIRTAATGVLLSALDVKRKVLLITSSVPGEGKSTFSLNFAYSQANSKRVLLIEADMRRPSLGPLLSVSKHQQGLSETIAGTVPLEDALVQIEGTSLSVLVAGHIPPNPLELLASNQFQSLILAMHERYDLIIIDSPPVQVVSDALVIAPCCTGTIYLVKASETPFQLAKSGLSRLAQTGSPVFGIVLNQQDFKRAERYYGEYSAYGKYAYSSGYVKSKV